MTIQALGKQAKQGKEMTEGETLDIIEGEEDNGLKKRKEGAT